jgi:hypothetical protein
MMQRIRRIAAASALALALSAAAAEPPPQLLLPPIDDQEIAAVRRVLQKHFTPREMDVFTGYLRDIEAGKSRPLPPEIKHALRGSIADLRLEYGLQLAILFAQIQQAHPGLVDGDINELLDRVQESLGDPAPAGPR